MILNFNAATVAPQQAFENLPTGWYVGRIVASGEKPNSAGTGSYLQLEIEIVSPPQYAGRKVWERLNLNNPNEKAVEIAYQTLSAICHATNVMQIQQSTQLHGIPMDVKLGLSKAQEGYEQRNEVKGYRPLTSSSGAPQPGAPAASAALAAGQWQQPAQAAPQQAAQQWQQPQAQQQAQPQAQAAQWQQPQTAQPQAQAEAQWQPQQQPVVQQEQAPVQQQAAPQQQWQPQVTQQQPAAEQAPQWANGAPQQAAQANQQQPAAQQGPGPEIAVVEQQPTNMQAQQAAASGKAPWQQ